MTLVYLEFPGVGALFTLGNCPDGGTFTNNLIFWHQINKSKTYNRSYLHADSGDCDASKAPIYVQRLGLSKNMFCSIETFPV